MSFRLDDLPLLDASGKVGRQDDASLSGVYHDPSTPSVVTQVASLGVALGIDAVRTLQKRFMPGTSELSAIHLGAASPSYTMYPDCTIYPDTDGCDAPCYGFPLDQMSSLFCATCDEQAADPTGNPSYNWHFSGMRGTLELMDREPDICNGRDAWKWKIDDACRGCEDNITFRCHDGWKRYEPGAALTPTICEGIVACDDELTLCP